MKINPVYRFFIWLLFILLVVFGALIYYFQHYEKELFLAALRASLNQNISASDVDYEFPFGFSLDDFQVEGVIQAKKLSAQLDLSSIQEKKLIVRELTLNEPVITWRKLEPPTAPPTTAVEPAQGATKPAAETPETAQPAHLVIKRL